MISICILIAAISLHAAVNAGADSAEIESLSAGFEAKYRAEYRACTGDTSAVSLDKIISWRQHIHPVTRSPAYRDILRDYMMATGRTENIMPCQVIQWHDARVARIARKDDSLAALAHTADTRAVDSIVMKENIRDNPASPYDMGSIPFGVIKPSFIWLFSREFKVPIEDMGAYVYARNFQIGGERFLAAFYFSESNRLYRYVIESATCPPDSADLAARGSAALLIGAFTKKLGVPSGKFSISIQEIKPGKLSPLARWNAEAYTAHVGLMLDKNRYFAQAIVEKQLK